MERGLASEVIAATALIASAVIVTALYYPGLSPELLLVVASLTSIYGAVQIAHPGLLAVHVLGCAGVASGITWAMLLCIPLAAVSALRGRRYWGLAPLLAAPLAMLGRAPGVAVGVAAAILPLAWDGFRARMHSMVYTVGLLLATVLFSLGVDVFYYYSLATAAGVYSVLVGGGFTRCPFRVEASSLIVAQAVMIIAALLSIPGLPGLDKGIVPLLYAAGYYTFTASLLAPTRVAAGGAGAGSSSNT